MTKLYCASTWFNTVKREDVKLTIWVNCVLQLNLTRKSQLPTKKYELQSEPGAKIYRILYEIYTFF